MDENQAEALTLIREAERIGATRLDLSGLGLAALPPEIGRVTGLTHLSLRENQLTALPDEIGELVALEQLSLADNRLEILPETIGRLHALTHLNLKNNALTELPSGLLSLTRLESLQLAGNFLPLPDGLIAKWNRPREITTYYRDHCLVAPQPPPPSLADLVGRYFDVEALHSLWAELAVPQELKPDGGHEQFVRALVAYHISHGLEGELRELFQIFVPHISWAEASLDPDDQEPSLGV